MKECRKQNRARGERRAAQRDGATESQITAPEAQFAKQVRQFGRQRPRSHAIGLTFRIELDVV
jgi:hypothetical protein